MVKSVCSVIFLFLGLVSFAESGKEFLEKVRANYESLKSLNLTMQYELYKGHTSEVIHESYNAFYARSGNETYRHIGQTELITNEKFSIQINHRDKIIVLSDPAKAELFEADIKTTLGFCQDVIVKEEGDMKAITLLIKPKSDLPYSRIAVIVDKKYNVSKMFFFYATEMNFASDYGKPDWQKPKLIVHYSDLEKKWKDNDGLLETERYLTIEKNKISPAEKYAGYSILNLTNTLTNE